MLKRFILTYNSVICVKNLPFRCFSSLKEVKRMKYLNVAEKNDAAKNIANFLSRGTSRRRDGFSQYNKIYEFEAEVLGQQSTMVMTSVSGHLLALDFVAAYKGWQVCNPVQLFEAPVYKFCPKDYEKIKKTLQNEMRSCNALIIWTDCDREGENIGFEIIEVCKAVKPNIQIYRAKFSEITGISVRRALNNLEQPNKCISDAVDVRQELDLRIGAAFTRFQTLRLQKVFPTKLANHLISYGSCQFPTLGFVVERYRAVENFIAEPFWKIKVTHTMNNLTVEFTWDRVRLFDRDACQVLHDICMEQPTARVTEVKTKPKSKWRPLPLDTVELEKLASRKLKISAKQTMKIAEKLYTQGFISYPRTETNEYPKEMNLTNLVTMHTGDQNWGSFAQRILDQGGPRPRQGNKSDKAHPPIHPTKYTNGLSGEEKRIYEFIVRSFLACCSKDAQGQETTVCIDLAGEKFTASGLMILERNYLDVYPYDKWSAKEIHVYQEGQQFDPTSIDLSEGNTSPPNLLTEADLIALMEKHGIGTDATHAEHIETIKNRSYVALLDTAHFVPGILGMGLVDGYDNMGLPVAKPNLRAQLEADLKLISEGRKQPAAVLAEQIEIYKRVFMTVTSEVNKLDAALAERFNERPAAVRPEGHGGGDGRGNPTVSKCPKCGLDMTLRTKRDSDEHFIGCQGYPACKNSIWLPKIVKTVTVTDESCEQCGPAVKKLKFEWKKNTIEHLYPNPYTGCISGCDNQFLEILNINSSYRRINAPEASRPIENNTQLRSSEPNLIARAQNEPNFRAGAPNEQNFRARAQNEPNFRAGTQNEPNFRARTQNEPNFRAGTQNEPNFRARAQNNSSDALSSGLPNTGPNVSRTNFMNAAQVNNTDVVRATFNGNAGPSRPISSDNEVVCSCNKHAILLTVKKQTPNFGKKFYKCALSKENGGCDFFLWAPDAANDVPSTTSHVNQPQPTSFPWGMSQSRNDDRNRSNDSDVKCLCGLSAKQITVHKEGPNKGRPFYSCSKPFSERCKFFEWADQDSNVDGQWGQQDSEASSSRGHGAASFRGRGKKTGTARGGNNPGTARKCGHCRKEGHNKKNCPDLRE